LLFAVQSFKRKKNFHENENVTELQVPNGQFIK